MRSGFVFFRSRSRIYSAHAFTRFPMRMTSSWEAQKEVADLVVEKPKYRKLFDEESKENTKLLEAMASSSSILSPDIGAGVRVLSLDSANDVIRQASLAGSRKDIYVRDFYPRLFTKLRSLDKSILLGNPGVGKSWFQFYYIAALVNPKELLGSDTLPPNHLGSCDPIEVVVRQLAAEEMIVYFLKAKKAHVVRCAKAVLDCFEQRTTLYLYEPGESLNEPYIVDLTDLQTCITVSPNGDRYKQFHQQVGAQKLFMPSFSLQELQAIGKHIVKTNTEMPKKLKDSYSEDKIEERFDEFGGIIRYVLPYSDRTIKTARSLRTNALSDCDPRALLVSSIESPRVSHLIAQYDVEKDGEEAFTKYRMQLIPFVTPMLEGKFDKLSLSEMIEALKRNDRVGDMEKAMREVFEQLVARHLTSPSGVKWKTRLVTEAEWQDFSLCLNRLERSRDVVPYDDMEPNVLYYNFIENFVLVEMFYKDAEGTIVGFQISREAGKRNLDAALFPKFAKKLGLDSSAQDKPKLIYYYVPKPSSWELPTKKRATNKVVHKNTDCLALEENKFFSSYEFRMLKIPPTYSARFKDEKKS